MTTKTAHVLWLLPLMVGSMAIRPGGATLSGTAGAPGQPAAKPTAVLYVVSRAASMAGVLPQMKQELTKSVDAMADGTAPFDVILIVGTDTPKRLSFNALPPTAANIKKADDFIDKITAAGAAPKLGPVLTSVLALKPATINLTVDAAADVAKVDDWVKTVNRAKAAGITTTINCVYLQGETEDAPLRDALKQLAAAGNGAAKVVLKKDM